MLTETNREIVKTLAVKVRVLTLEHLAMHWFSHLRRPRESAARAARKLESEELINKRPVVVAMPHAIQPLMRLERSTGESVNFQKLQYQNQRRWNIPLTRTSALTALPKAHGLFGGEPRDIRASELEHDAALASAFLRIRSTHPESANTWLCEDSLELGEFGERRPDATYINGEKTIVEVVGRGYDAAKLESIATHYRHTTLEFW